jgi:N-carbamoylputrescine amidase
MQDVARKHDVVVICPIFEKESSGVFYNSAVVIDAGGGILGNYRKVHVPQIPLWEERYYFTPGNLGFPIFETKHAVVAFRSAGITFSRKGRGSSH